MKPVVLFVDDEPNILRGLQRLTRSQRRLWDMQFYETGAKALNEMETSHVDVVVCDMRMPEMNGADLLEKVSQQFPHIIRIILSGEAKRDQTYRTIGRSHRFVAKPCEADTLISAIEAPLNLRNVLGNEEAAISSSIYDHLRSSPITFENLEAMLEQEEPPADKITALIRQDPNLTARLLQIANSAYFGRPQSTCSISKAIRAIGFETLQDLLQLKRLGNCQPEQSELTALSNHVNDQVEIAKAAARITEYNGAGPDWVETVYTAGLLANLGALNLKREGGSPLYQYQSLGRAAYITTLLGLPQMLASTYLSMMDLKQDFTLSQMAQSLSNCLQQKAA